MKILTLILLSFNAYSNESKIDTTRLRMELDYLKSTSKEKIVKEEPETPKTQISDTKDLKFRRAKKVDPEILPLDQNFDQVNFQYSAPRRKADVVDEKEKIKNEIDSPRINGQVPKDLFEE